MDAVDALTPIMCLSWRRDLPASRLSRLSMLPSLPSSSSSRGLETRAPSLCLRVGMGVLPEFLLYRYHRMKPITGLQSVSKARVTQASCWSVTACWY